VWWPKSVIVVSTLLLIGIPAAVHRRTTNANVVKSQRGVRERILLAFVSFGFLLVLIWIVSPVLAFAEYAPRRVPFIAGVACLAGGLWLLYRAHSDLGVNWSVTLEVRENHQLIIQGVYRRVRHPMYLSLLLYALGQALVLPNLVAGPFYFVALVLLFALRFRPEEGLMLEEFGEAYGSYMARTKRLIPGIW
jgi:protein-S-isoprenylcysteine O-methyltransferase Ste14